MSSISQQGGDSETARAIARPPFLFLVALLLGFVSDHLLPLPFPISRIGLAHWISAGVAGSLIFIGIGVFAAGIRNFSSAATPVQGTRPNRALVTTGIHGWSRNPIYLGMFLIYGGIGIVVRSVCCFSPSRCATAWSRARRPISSGVSATPTATTGRVCAAGCSC